MDARKLNAQLFHFHNPKAAGTSFAKYLVKHFEGSKIAPLIENNKFDHENLCGDYSAFCGYDFYSGHYGFDVYKSVAEGYYATTSFRNPIDRVISLYNFFRNSVNLPIDDLMRPEHYCIRASKTMEFENFVSNNTDGIELYISNYHYRQLCNSGWDLLIPTNPIDVYKFIDKMPFYFVSEEPDIGHRWAQKWFDNYETTVSKENQTFTNNDALVKRSDLNQKTLDIILNKNLKDMTIYDYAINKIMRITI